MPCLFALLAGAFPRIAAVLVWLARPEMWSAAFNGGWLIPLLGVIFLPFTTIIYVIVWSPTGLTGWDWLWVGLALVLDIMHYGHTGYQNQDQIPGVSSDSAAS